jgi:hypothetical protein
MPNHQPARKTRYCSGGFTLVEVVTAALVGSLLLAIFLMFSFRFTQVFKELNGAEIKISTDANHVLDRIEEDLGSAIFQKDRFEWLAYWNHPDDAQSALGTFEKKNITQGQRIAEFQLKKSGVLLCISRSPHLSEVEKEDGDVISVAYRIAYHDPVVPEDPQSPGSTFCLYRIPNPPSVTYDNYLIQRNLTEPWKGNKTSGGTSFAADPPYDINSILPEFLQIQNVAEFSIEFHCSYLPKIPDTNTNNRNFRNPKYFRIPYQSDTFIRIGGESATNENAGSGGNFPSDLPELARVYPTTAIVRLTLLDDEGMKMFRAAREGKRPDIKDLEQLIELYGHRFQRTILLPQPI